MLIFIKQIVNDIDISVFMDKGHSSNIMQIIAFTNSADNWKKITKSNCIHNHENNRDNLQYVCNKRMRVNSP